MDICKTIRGEKVDNELIELFINMKISQIKRELAIANRYWKADLKGQLSAYQDMSEFLKGVEDAKLKKHKEINSNEI